jgi:outer membrane protein assembly factor BamB
MLSRSSPRRLPAVLAAAIAAIAVLLAAPAAHADTSWLTYGFDSQRTGYNPQETGITSANASQLRTLWSRNLGDVMIAQPVEAAGVKVGGVATNVVYEGTEHGILYALRASDGKTLWFRRLASRTTQCWDMPDHVFGIGGAGAISFTAPGTGVLYVAGGDGAVHALDLATGAEESGWPLEGVFDASQEHVYSGLNLVGDKLYLTTAGYCDIAPYYSGATEIDTSTHRVLAHYYPAGPPRGGISGGGIWGPGGVSVDPANNEVYAATGNALRTPENYASSDAVVELSPSLKVVQDAKPALTGDDVDFGSTPLLFHPSGCPQTLLAAKNKSGVMLIYAEDRLRNGPVSRLAIAAGSDDEFNGIPAWDPATNMLYIGNSSDSTAGTYEHGMVALKATGCTFSLAWQQPVGPSPTSVSPPTVANGVVFYGDGFGNTEYAFDATTGQPLWTSRSVIAGALYAAPMVANGQLYVPAWDGRLYVFAPTP